MHDALIVFIIFFSFVSIIKILSENRTRRMLINKGELNKELLPVLTGGMGASPLQSMKWGLVLVGIGLALLLGRLFPEDISNDITLAMMFIFAGVGFLVYYFISKKQLGEHGANTNHSDS